MRLNCQKWYSDHFVITQVFFCKLSDVADRFKSDLSMMLNVLVSTKHLLKQILKVQHL